MLGRSLVQRVKPVIVQQIGTRRNAGGGVPNMLMSQVWRKSTGLYVTYILAGCVVIETVYGGLTDMLWRGSNNGKTFETVDWSKWKAVDDDDDDEDEDDE